MIIASLLLLMSFASNLPADQLLADSDNDGLTDRLEQELLAKFTPKFMLSAKECDGLPAEFRPGAQEPQLMAKNGTIYGQVFQIAPRGRSGIYLEIHYYHLWNRDCGLNGHALDAEHVSALVWAATVAEPAAFWKAKYWYAAAHEETICDASHAVRSSLINAEQQGPTVWISAGKHASFLDQELCKGGCGGDNCKAMHPLTISGLINLGERSAPMNGALWIEWHGWPLAAKMETDFPEPVLAKLDSDKPSVIVPVNESQPPIKATILAGSTTAGALIVADRKTDTALSAADGAIGTSIDKSTGATGNSLKRAARAVWKALRGSGSQGKEDKMNFQP